MGRAQGGCRKLGDLAHVAAIQASLALCVISFKDQVRMRWADRGKTGTEEKGRTCAFAYMQSVDQKPVLLCDSGTSTQCPCQHLDWATDATHVWSCKGKVRGLCVYTASSRGQTVGKVDVAAAELLGASTILAAVLLTS